MADITLQEVTTLQEGGNQGSDKDELSENQRVEGYQEGGNLGGDKDGSTENDRVERYEEGGNQGGDNYGSSENQRVEGGNKDESSENQRVEGYEEAGNQGGDKDGSFENKRVEGYQEGRNQRTASSGSLVSSNENQVNITLETTESLVDFNADPEPTAPTFPPAQQTSAPQPYAVEVKPSEITEISEVHDQGWQAGHPQGMGSSMQYNINVEAIPSFSEPSSSTNLFDVNSQQTPDQDPSCSVEEKKPDTGESNQDRWFKPFKNLSNPSMARYAYNFIFLAANILAWSARDQLKKIKGLRICMIDKECLGANGVLRVSLGSFLFFTVMFWSTRRASKLNEAKDKWHSGWWSMKIVLWILLTIIQFLLPPIWMELYGQIAQFGVGTFYLIQLISTVSFINKIHDYFVSETNVKRFKIHVMILATASYCLCLVGIILMYIWYASKPSCILNILFITWCLVLLILMTTVSILPKVNGGLLSPGLMGLYVVSLCWSAIKSEPERDQCTRKAGTAPETDWLSIMSFVIGVLTIVYATFSTCISSETFKLKKSEKPAEENDVPYGYGFFHFVFAIGAMYFAMLMIGWNSHFAMKKWSLDVGWTSVWLKIVVQLLAVFVYLWILIAPIWKNRRTEST